MFHTKAIVHLSKRRVIRPPRGFGNSGMGLFSVRENEKYRSGIRENDFVRDSGKHEISFGNSGKSKYLFGNS